MKILLDLFEIPNELKNGYWYDFPVFKLSYQNFGWVYSLNKLQTIRKSEKMKSQLILIKKYCNQFERYKLIKSFPLVDDLMKYIIFDLD